MSTSFGLNASIGFRDRAVLAGLLEPPESTVLTGSLDGIGVVPKGTPLTRLNYFDGRFLRADDLQLEQRYVRSLVAQSNRAGGSGVSDGFDVSGSGGAITIGGGLAISPTGRVIYLPGATPSLPVDELIAASQELTQATSGSEVSKARSSFSDCELKNATGDPTLAPVADAWVITVGPADAACGDEDVYGRLCDDACVTDSQKSYLVDGVAVRMVPLVLTHVRQPSTVVPDDPINLRSRLAVAYFRTERERIADLRSGNGLASPTWCLGAPAETGDAVPIAVLVRGGGKTQFIDPWIVRREIFEPPPARYWGWRTGRRPMAAFMAQVLQFQCQLVSAVATGPQPDDPNDPCADERVAIGRASELIDEMESFYSGVLDKVVALDVGSPKLSMVKIAEVRASLSKAAAGGASGGSTNRRLIAHGILDAPPAGFLPVTPGARSVEDDVRAWFGEGVDLRFCTAREDVIAQAFDQAQHLDRVSLTQGLDDPTKMDDVDVLVPDGIIERDEGKRAGNGLRARLTLFPQFDRINASAAAELDGAGQFENLRSGGIAVAVGASGAAPERLAVGTLVSFLYQAAATKADDAEAAKKASELRDRVARTEKSALHEISSDPKIHRRLRDAARSARTHVRAVESIRRRIAVEAEPQKMPVFAPSAATKRPIGWFSSLRFEHDPARLAEAKSIPVSFELVGAAPAADLQALVRTSVSGTFMVDRFNEVGGGFSASGWLVGPGSWLVVADGKVTSDGGSQLSLPMTVGVASPLPGRPAGVEVILGLDPKMSSNLVGHQLIFKTRLDRDTDSASGSLIMARDDNLLGEIGLKARASSAFATADREAQPLFSFELTPDQAVLAPGNPNRDNALQGVEYVAAMLADRDPGFTERAVAALFPRATQQVSAERIRATRDWVMFHRRAERTCIGDRPPAPVATARYRVLHAAVDSLEDAERLRREIAVGKGADRLDDVAVVEFEGGSAALESSEGALLDDWRQVSPGNVIRFALVAPTLGNTSLAEQRLRRVGQVVRDVSATVTDTVTETLPTVPGGIEAREADGVMVIITLFEQQTTCHTVWRLDSDVGMKLGDKAFDRGLANLAKAGAVELFGTVNFDADSSEIVDGIDELIEKWGAPEHGNGPRVVVFSTPGNAEAGTDAMLRQRGLSVALKLGYDNPVVEVRRVDELADGCPAATVILERPVGSCLSVFLLAGTLDQLREIEKVLASGDVKGLIDLPAVESLGQVTFRAGGLDASDISGLTTGEVAAGSVRVSAVTATKPDGDPEPNLVLARAERATELAIGVRPSTVVPVPVIESFPDIDCPSLVLIIAIEGFIDFALMATRG